jgi:hypothetical protein
MPNTWLTDGFFASKVIAVGMLALEERCLAGHRDSTGDGGAEGGGEAQELHLVLGRVSNKPVLVREGDIRRGDAVALVVGDDLDLQGAGVKIPGISGRFAKAATRQMRLSLFEMCLPFGRKIPPSKCHVATAWRAWQASARYPQGGRRNR